jgi:hypothetical protein
MYTEMFMENIRTLDYFRLLGAQKQEGSIWGEYNER